MKPSSQASASAWVSAGTPSISAGGGTCAGAVATGDASTASGGSGSGTCARTGRASANPRSPAIIQIPRIAMSPRHAAGPAAARTAPAGMFHFAINILIRELSTHLANPGPRRDHVVSGGETPGVADVGDANEPQEPTRNDLATPHDRHPAALAARPQRQDAQGNEPAPRAPVCDSSRGPCRPAGPDQPPHPATTHPP